MYMSLVEKLVVANYKANAYPPQDIWLIMPYSEQQLRCKQTCFNLSANGALPRDCHPKICTASSSQGQESKAVILDWVISAAEVT